MTQSTDPYDYKRFAVLFVDDEEKARKYFQRLFGGTFRILEAADGNEAFEVFHAHPGEVGVIVTDQRMPNETGSAFLARLGEEAGNVVKILSTAYADLDAAIDSVNRGGIYRYLTKPWDIPELELTLKRAMEFFIVKHERDALLRAKIQALGNMLFASRLASFALVPVAAGLDCRRAAEAVADFVRLGAATAQSEPPGSYGDDWRTRHERQLGFAALLQQELAAALGKVGGAAGPDALAPLTEALAGHDPAFDAAAGSLAMAADPFPAMLGTLLGRRDSAEPRQVAMVLAATMAFYHTGGRLSRQRSDAACLIKVTTGREADADTQPGDEAARWLFDDEMLLSTALGLL